MGPFGSLRNTQISPTAVLLTGAAVVAAMIIGLTGPRLRDRHGTGVEELPIGELAYMAELLEARQAFEVAHARAKPAAVEEAQAGAEGGDQADPEENAEGAADAPGQTPDRPPLQSATASRVAVITQEAFGRSIAAPDLSKDGFTPLDARIVQLAPNARALAVLYERAQSRSRSVVTVYAMPDSGRIVRIDGFGGARPFAPGDEWASAGMAERDGPPRTIYATTDQDTLWLLLAPDPRTVMQLAPLLAGGMG